jgi:hypothetical protein
MSLPAAKSTPTNRSSSETAEARPPFGEEMRVVLFDDVENFVKLMLFESFVPAQANRLQPEFTAVSRLFNVNVRRLEFIREIEVKPKTIFAQNGRHNFNPPKTDNPNPWR